LISSCGLSDPGCERPENEDRILLDEDLGLFAVADGMGGHASGEVAATMALAAVRHCVQSSRDRLDVTWPFGYNFSLSLDENRLCTAFQLGNRQVWIRSDQAPEHAGMGTTLTAVLIREDRAAVASVGDSRAYLFRGGQLDQLTVDDTWVEAMIRQGTLDRQRAREHPMRSVLTQAAGAREAVEVRTIERPLRDQDLLLLSTDGLHAVVEEEAIRAALASGDSLPPMARRLIEAARASGGPDNVSCILIRYSQSAP